MKYLRINNGIDDIFSRILLQLLSVREVTASF